MPRNFGHPSGVLPGATFTNREAAATAGVHQPTVAGISGGQAEGADSIVLSGGYEDDEDDGYEIIYTGHGGNNPNTNKQIRDQTLTAGNMALAMSQRENLPVRVLRGAKHAKGFKPRAAYERFAPPTTGYRYDGLYRVASFWPAMGKSGFRIWRFRLTLIASGEDDVVEHPMPKGTTSPGRSTGTTSRIVRDHEVERSVKKLYANHCQVCGETVETVAGPYAEGCHIRPLGRPHDGPDVVGNLLCLCPNHHKAFDGLGFTVEDDGTLVGIAGKLTIHRRHKIDRAHLQYHRELYRIATQ